MSRRRRASPGVSLFPFLSILSCVIGTLTLVIAGLAMGEIATPPPEPEAESPDAAEYRELLDEKQRLERETAELQALIEQVERREAELTQLEAQLAEAREQAPLWDAIADLEREIAAMQQQVDEAEAKTGGAAEWFDRMAERRKKQQDAEAERARNAFLLRPSGSGKDLVPYFVDCLPDGIILYPDKPESQQVRVPVDRILDDDGPVDELMRLVKRDPRGTVIMLVRPGGVQSYKRTEATANYFETKNGAMPVPGSQQIDFRMFLSDREDSR